VKTNLLSARKVEEIIRSKQWGLHHDGGGLYLVGSRKYKTFSWILRVYRSTVTGRPRDMGLGRARDLTLKEAREKARKLRQIAADGIDPVEERRERRDQQRAEALSRSTFKDAALEFISLHSPTWKNAKHRAQWKSSLEAYAFRTLGSRPVLAIDGAAITEALSPIWMSKVETASRVKQRIERVIQWVKDGKPLPHQGASKRVNHHGALPFEELPQFIGELRKRDSISARALEFTILTAARTGDTIGAKWGEINFNTGVWTVSDGRHKTSKDFEIPLSKRALEILKALPRERGSPHVFPGGKAGQPLSNMAMLELLRGLGGNGFTVHGFRSTFRDWAGDRTNFAREVIEHAMSHQIKDKAEASYRRSTALDKRRQLMETWATYCASPVERTENVVSLHGAA
jgi:integrase